MGGLATQGACAWSGCMQPAAFSCHSHHCPSSPRRTRPFQSFAGCNTRTAASSGQTSPASLSAQMTNSRVTAEMGMLGLADYAAPSAAGSFAQPAAGGRAC